MNPLAKSLNDALEGTAAGRLLSGLGRELYFPKGIIAQGAQAKKAASFANGTIGMAYSGGKPLILSALADCAPELSADEIVAYAPTAGTEKAREAWKKALLKKNPSLETLGFSMPAVTAGLTSGLSCVADLFFGAGDVALASGPCWDNYDLIFETRRQARLSRVPFFAPDAGAGSGLDIAGIRAAILESAKSGSARIVFNFPNNPAGYSPGAREAGELAGIVREAAEGGADVLVICDDAYFGLFYEADAFRESLFSKMAGLHERVLAVKIDGPIKEDFAWGLRIGFVTFASKGLEPARYEALVTKLTGALRSTVSCASTVGQSMLVRAMEDPRTEGEKAAYAEILRRRYRLVKDYALARRDFPYLRALPFNSGYFMSFASVPDAEDIRLALLEERGIGLVSLGPDCLRVAYSGIEEDKIVAALDAAYETAERLAKKG